MTTKEKMNSLKKTARIAGLLILIISVFAPFSMMYVPSNLIVPGDAATTANNIVASPRLKATRMAAGACEREGAAWVGAATDAYRQPPRRN